MRVGRGLWRWLDGGGCMRKFAIENRLSRRWRDSSRHPIFMPYFPDVQAKAVAAMITSSMARSPCVTSVRAGRCRFAQNVLRSR